MGAPYGRKSRSRTNHRRSNNMQYTAPSYINCPNCNEPALPHRICNSCGFYKGRAVLQQAAPKEE
ncbi:MAG: 50S ribosomal protein L32 [Myxococcota bacterium]